MIGHAGTQVVKAIAIDISRSANIQEPVRPKEAGAEEEKRANRFDKTPCIMGQIDKHGSVELRCVASQLRVWDCM